MSNALGLKRGQSLSTEAKLDVLLELRDKLERGYSSISTIATEYGVTKQTASEWRKQALILIEKDNNGYTREGIRNIQIGRIQYQIERLQAKADAETDTEQALKIHDRIVKYYDSLSRITGLNHEQVLHQHQQIKPLQVIMSDENGAHPTDKEPTP